MKTLNKVLCLVLALCIVLSCGAFAAGYDKFTDKADAVASDYTEAIDVVTGLKIINGMTETELGLDGTLTREQAAKIVAYVKVGQKLADTLSTGNDPFDDVAASRWSAGYVGYCVSEKLLSGYGDGNFGPADSLTGYAFGKMLLNAMGIGYETVKSIEGGIIKDVDINRYTGATWEFEVAKDLFGDYKFIVAGIDNIDFSAPMTRAQAMQMVFNVVTVKTNDTAAIAALNTKVFKDYRMVKTDVLTENGVDGYKWKVDGKADSKAISALYNSEKLVKASTDGTTLAKLTTPKGEENYDSKKFVAELEDGVEYFVNGTKVTLTEATANKYAMVDGALVYGITPDTVGLNGVTIKLVNTDKDDEIEKVYYEIAYFDKVTDIDTTDETKTVGAYTTYTFAGGAEYDVYTTNVNDEEDEATVYAGIAKNDYVMILPLADCAVVTKADSFVGTLTSKTSKGVYTIGGNTYKMSALANESGKFVALDAVAYNTESEFYTDANGYIVAADVDTTKTDDVYAFVLDAVAKSDNATFGAKYSLMVKLVLADGTTVEAKVAKVYDTNAYVTLGTGNNSSATNDPSDYVAAVNGKVVSYSVNADGNYIVKAEAATTYTSDANEKLTVAPSAEGKIAYKTLKNKAQFVTKYTATGNSTAADWGTPVAQTLVANAKTTFVVATTKDNKTTYATYTGIANLPTMNNVTVNAFVKNGVCSFVYIVNGGTVAATTDSYVFFTDTAYSFYPESKDGADDAYRVYDAIVKGEKTTVKVYAEADNTNPGVAAAVKLYKVTYTDGVITAAEEVAAKTGVKYNYGIIDTAYDTDHYTEHYTYTDDVAVYVINTTNTTVKTVDVDAIKTSQTSKVTFSFTKDSNGQATTTAEAIYIVD